MDNKYLFIIDTDGKRITSLVVGVHADTMDDLKALAAKQYPGKTVLAGGEEQQQLFVNDNKLYVDGQFVDYVPTAEETQAANLAKLDADYGAQLDDLKDQIVVAATVAQDDAYADELRQQRQDLQTEYITKRGAL